MEGSLNPGLKNKGSTEEPQLAIFSEGGRTMRRTDVARRDATQVPKNCSRASPVSNPAWPCSWTTPHPSNPKKD